MNTITTIIITALASSGLFSFLQFLINRRDEKKKSETREIIKRLEQKICEIEKGSVRTQMLILMNHYPNESSRILMLAERYFSELQGDWYMTGIFNQWLMENQIGKPEWFKED